MESIEPRLSAALSQAAIRRFEPYTRETADGACEGRLWLHNGAVFTGSLRNGILSGRGECQWADHTRYVGGFARNAPEGAGEMTWPVAAGGWRYAGDFRAGLRDGTGVATSAAHGVEYRGSWRGGLRDGRGVCECTAAGWRYEGEFAAGERAGTGTMAYANGSVYGGGWHRGRKHGFGVMVWTARHEVYAGDWANGLPHGHGAHYYGVPDAALALAAASTKHTDTAAAAAAAKDPLKDLKLRINCYTGDWVAGERHGLGTFLYADGSRYTGGWSHNEKDGQGVAEFADGHAVSGAFVRDHAPATASTSAAMAALPTSPAATQSLVHRHAPELHKLYNAFSHSTGTLGRRLLTVAQFSRMLHCLGLDKRSEEHPTKSVHAELLQLVTSVVLRGGEPRAIASSEDVLLPHEFAAALFACLLQPGGGGGTPAQNDRILSEAAGRKLTPSRLSEAFARDNELNAFDLEGIEAHMPKLRRAFNDAALRGTAKMRDVLQLCAKAAPTPQQGVATAVSALHVENVETELCFFEFQLAVLEVVVHSSTQQQPPLVALTQLLRAL